jgi:hypothetical protein
MTLGKEVIKESTSHGYIVSDLGSSRGWLDRNNLKELKWLFGGF